MSLRANENSLPEADLLVVELDGTARIRDAADGAARREDTASSLRHDLSKLALYARTGVPEYWVADVAGRRIIRFHAPEGEVYARAGRVRLRRHDPRRHDRRLAVHTARLA
ncbi:Uma2 family endonuclease [Sphingomonas sp. MMS24-JH45]